MLGGAGETSTSMATLQRLAAGDPDLVLALGDLSYAGERERGSGLTGGSRRSQPLTGSHGLLVQPSWQDVPAQTPSGAMRALPWPPVQITIAAMEKSVWHPVPTRGDEATAAAALFRGVAAQLSLRSRPQPRLPNL